jgi:hypothetical protein
VLLILAGVYFGWIGILAALFIPVLGYYAHIYQEVSKERLMAFRKFIKSRTKKDMVEDLKLQRQSIFGIIDAVEI